MRLVLIINFFIFYSLVHGQQWQISDLGQSGRFDDIAQLASNTFITAQSRIVYKSENGGKNWRVIATHPQLGYVRSIDFLDDTLGFFGVLSTQQKSEGNLFRTRDGGLSIEPVITLGQMEGICALAHQGNTVLAAGTFADSPKVHISIDRGETFTTRSMGNYLGGITDCIVVNENTFLLAGTSGKATNKKPIIVISEDGGISWREILLVTDSRSGYIWKISLSNSNILYAAPQLFGPPAGFNDTKIWISKDLGASWESHPLSASIVDYGGVGFLNDTLGWICHQYRGNCLETRNGGKDWEQLPLDQIDGANRILITDKGKALASGTSVYTYDVSISNSSKINLKKEVKVEKYLKVIENPVKSELMINAYTDEATFGQLEVYTLHHQLVSGTERQVFETGNNKVAIQVNHLRPGTYFVVWKNSHQFIVEQFTKL